MATEITMNDLLQATIDEGASDLHVRAFMPPKLRIHGELVAIADEAFDEEIFVQFFAPAGGTTEAWCRRMGLMFVAE